MVLVVLLRVCFEGVGGVGGAAAETAPPDAAISSSFSSGGPGKASR